MARSSSKVLLGAAADSAGMDVTAKTFRTWGATLLAVAGFQAVADTPPPLRPDVVRTVIRAVADELGNTPAVCRRSYVHPGVVELFELGSLGRLWHERPRSRPRELIPEEHHLVHVLEHVGDDRPLRVGSKHHSVDRAAVRSLLDGVRKESERSVDEVAAKLRAR
jgi:DNA topoisomerase IB